MPKRKRSNNDEDDVDRIMRIRKQAVQDEISRGKKLLHRALKTAKGFERQKFGKRLKLATAKNEADEITRINNEMEALKTLDLDKVTVAQLHRSLLKVKEFNNSDLLPEEVRNDLPKPEGSEAEIKALHNVTSNMCNAKVVKEEIADLIEKMYGAMGIPKPTKEPKAKKVKIEVDEIRKEMGKERAEKKNMNTLASVEVEGGENESWEGVGSDEENEGSEQPNEDEMSLDEEGLQQFDALLGASSDEESFHEEDWLPKEQSEQTRFSFSPEPSLSPSISESQSSSSESEPEPEIKPEPKPESPKKKKGLKPKSDPVKPGNSTFLPSLMGGYWSGSESEASDFEDSRPAKKNRPGQMARRAIAEKKFGEKANHILSGKGPVAARGKDDGWDAKRGATDRSGPGRGRGGGSHWHEGRNLNRKERRALRGGTGGNATPIPPKEPVKKRDDVGVLHPSWQAAKKAKEMKKTTSFQGKKVMFD